MKKSLTRGESRILDEWIQIHYAELHGKTQAEMAPIVSAAIGIEVSKSSIIEALNHFKITIEPPTRAVYDRAAMSALQGEFKIELAVLKSEFKNFVDRAAELQKRVEGLADEVQTLRTLIERRQSSIEIHPSLDRRIDRDTH